MIKLLCKKTNSVLSDYENKNGSITRHLKSLNISIPSSFIRRKYYKENNEYWHTQFFEKLYVNEKNKLKCKICDWTTFDENNRSGAYTTHLINTHGIEFVDYIKIYPEDSNLFKTLISKFKFESHTELDDYHVKCKICDKKLRYITNTHLTKHGTNPEEYKLKYGINDFASIKFKEKTRKNLSYSQSLIERKYESKPEKELKAFLLDELKLNIISNDKKIFNGIEIDIIIPDRKICIEFNGNLYHSENYGKKDKNFHLNKTEICEKKGYKLIHIQEDEWFIKNEIVKSRLSSILMMNNNLKLYARNCKIKQINSKLKGQFLNENHLQGNDKSNNWIGAYYNDELVSVMTFSNTRNMISKENNEYEYELKRFVVKKDYNIIGLFSKLLAFFVNHKKVNKIFSFLDRRWNPDKNNNVYQKNGFILKNILGPDYSYYNSKINRYKRFHKFLFGKSSIKRKFPMIFDSTKTEWQMMQEAGFDRIWDCGKFRYVMEFNPQT